jgi:hypothetical protein
MSYILKEVHIMCKVSFRNMNENSARNFNEVSIGNVDLYFSYETIVGFRAPGYGLVVCENSWGSTTGKHLNWLDGGDKKSRLPYGVFDMKLRDMLNEHGLA